MDLAWMDILDLLHIYFLPHLSLRDFGSLACTATALRSVVNSSPTALWKVAAVPKLGVQHPALQGSRLHIQEALRQQSRGHEN